MQFLWVQKMVKLHMELDLKKLTHSSQENATKMEQDFMDTVIYKFKKKILKFQSINKVFFLN